MLIIGESLNGTIPAVNAAIVARDANFVTNLARKQVECGAQMLDLNAAVAGQDEAENLVWMLDLVQKATDVALVLDSGNPEALRAAIEIYRGERLIISSISAKPESISALLPIAKEKGCGLVVLCMAEKEIPKDAKGRLAVAEQLINLALKEGLSPEQLYVDPLVMTMSADWQAGQIVLETMRLLRQHFPLVNTYAGLSNIGFGMPARTLLNQTMVAMMLALGLEALMVDTRNAQVMATIHASAALIGEDQWCRNYTKAFRAGKLG